MNQNELVDSKIPLIFAIMGAMILAGYYRIIKQGKTDKFWTNNNTNRITKNIKKVYIFMIMLSTISTIYLIYYLSVTHTNDELLRYSGIIIFLTFSLVWAFSPFYFSKIILFMVALGVVLLLAGISSDKDDSTKGSLALAACSILLIQSFVFDFVLWNGLI